MTEPSHKNMSDSVRAKLLRLAHSSNRDFQSLVLRYSVERFLVRLVSSPHRDRFILKGAMLFVAWRLDENRNTMDLDLLGKGKPDPERLAMIFREICAVSTADDGLAYDTGLIIATPIRADAVYDGVRIVVPVHLGAMIIRMQIDVGFGDVIVPAPRRSEFPALLTDGGPIVDAYAPETVIAEKYNAMVQLGMANSRMKDYFDIWMLSRKLTFEESILSVALSSTFANRKILLPESLPLGLSDEFAHNDAKRRQWEGFVKRQNRIAELPVLHEVVLAIRDFLMPVRFSNSAQHGAKRHWIPGRGWKDDDTIGRTTQ